MDKLADPDTTFLVPCAHCDALLQEGDRFCTACGEDQLFSSATASALAADRGPARAGIARTQGVGWLKPRSGDPAEPDVGIAPVPEPAPGAVRASGRRRPSAAAVLGIVCAVALVVFASLWASGHLGGQREQDGRQRAYETAVAQMRAALDRGDLAAAERAFGLLNAQQTSAPGVQALRQGLDERLREHAQRREQLNDAALSASRSLGYGKAAAAQEAPPAPAAPAVPTAPVAPQPECSDALLALSLCQRR